MTLTKIFSRIMRSKKYGFTLPEILITLAIIGIIASITIPTIMANYQKRVLKSQFNKTYNELQQVNAMFVKDYDMNICEYNWNVQSTGVNVQKAMTETAKIFIKYYSSFDSKNQTGFNRIGYYEIKTLNGNNTQAAFFDDGGGIDMHARTYYFEFGYSGRRCPVITVDINGYYKKPNRLGIDIFSFRPTKNGKIVPIGEPDSDSINGNLVSYGSLVDCSWESTKTLNGVSCAYWASIDINPENHSQTYWKDFIK